MSKIAFVTQKGGSGKSTLAVNLTMELATKTTPQLLLDLDPQASAMAWKAQRRDAPIPNADIVHFKSPHLQERIAWANQVKAGLVIDTQGHMAEQTTEYARQADLILVPCTPSAFDTNTLRQVAKLVAGAGKPAFVVVNQAPTGQARYMEEITQVIAGYGIPLAPVVIHRRAAFVRSASFGESVREYEPAGKAAEEIATLAAWVRSQL